MLNPKQNVGAFLGEAWYRPDGRVAWLLAIANVALMIAGILTRTFELPYLPGVQKNWLGLALMPLAALVMYAKLNTHSDQTRARIWMNAAMIFVIGVVFTYYMIR